MCALSALRRLSGFLPIGALITGGTENASVGGRNFIKPLFILALLVTSEAALAQPPMAQPPQMIPTNRPGVWSYPVPPLGFDPTVASDSDLQAYGFPPKPANPAALDAWKMIVSHAGQRIVPEFGTSSIKHRPIQETTRDFDGNLFSENWSGVALVPPSTNIFNAVSGIWNIPSVTLPTGLGCSSAIPGYYSSTWVGIDGFNDNVAVQAGTSQNVTCAGTQAGLQYFAWWEWFPDFEIPIANFAVNPGDSMMQEVFTLTVSQAGGNGAANFFLLDFTTGISTAFRAANPNPSPADDAQGNSAEWILEATTVDGSITTLPKFGTVYFAKTVAGTVLGDIEYPGVPGNALVNYIILEQGGEQTATPLAMSPASQWITSEFVNRELACGLLKAPC
jgi:hypothetical protein